MSGFIVYENAVEGLKESGLNVMSTELSLEFVCLPDGSDFVTEWPQAKYIRVKTIQPNILCNIFRGQKAGY